ncbi:MAG: bifunctional 5,10-methylenetetrahydrofolate dehydrogenase/5,10-methenyltetrahydrofolate cyclohydrolase [Novosphingobium sp.]
MTALLLDGHEPARRLLEQAAAKALALRDALGRPPRLAALVAGRNPGALAYWERIGKFAKAAHVETVLADVTADSIFDELERLNADSTVDGILPFAPLPQGIELARIAAVLSPTKDVDGLTPHNAGLLARGLPGLYPCTPQAAIALAEETLGDLRGVEATVVGASIHVGRPLAELLLQRGATVTIAHIDTRDLAASCRKADLLFVAVGKAGLLNARHLKQEATVIDIGINLIDGDDGMKRIVGDVEFDSAARAARAISAVPDGVGPLTTAFLISNTVHAAASGRNAGTGTEIL